MRANFALYLTVGLDELLVNREEGPERWAPLSGVVDIYDPIDAELLLVSRVDALLLYCREPPGSGRAIFYPILAAGTCSVRIDRNRSVRRSFGGSS